MKLLLTFAFLSLPLWLSAQVNQVQPIAPNVYFHEGNIKDHGHCNNGWIVFEDYVLVIDGNFPSGALEILPKIKATSDQPIRFAFDTHHHGDHAYGNQVWVDVGAVPVAHEGVLEEMKKYEPRRWEDTAKNRADVAASKLKPPTVLFRKEMFFDDGQRRVELLHFGVAHTHGDGFAWMPNERILFTGDACVNGPYNYMGDGDSGEWIKTLEAAKELKPRLICPGHGPMGGPEILDDQIAFFVELRREVAAIVECDKTFNVKVATARVREALSRNDQIERYVGDSLQGQVTKVYFDLTGKAVSP